VVVLFIKLYLVALLVSLRKLQNGGEKDPLNNININ